MPSNAGTCPGWRGSLRPTADGLVSARQRGAAVGRHLARLPDTAVDRRRDYARDAILLALERTRSRLRPYRLMDSSPMNKRQALLSAQANERPTPHHRIAGCHPGPGLALCPSRSAGINGYRVCFALRERLPELAQHLEPGRHGALPPRARARMA